MLGRSAKNTPFMKDLKTIGTILFCTSFICKYIKYYSYKIADEVSALGATLPHYINKEKGGVSWQHLQIKEIDYDVWLFYVGIAFFLIGIIYDFKTNKTHNK
jgi:hypothetical protein